MKNKPLFSFALFVACFMGVLAYGQTQVAPFVNSHVQFSNASGAAPCNGCLLDTFAAGTTTPLATYSESTGTTPNANPVVLASDGSAVVYLTNASYKFRLRTAAGVTIWTQDNVTWNNLATTLSSLTLTGNATINSSTAATNVANQSGPTLCMDGNFWNGAASAVDSWCWNDVLGTGTNPTSTLTLVHSGSSGTPVFSVPALSATSVSSTGAVTGASVTASGAVSGASHVGPTGNQGILVKDINVGSAFTAFGDSITQGFNATDAAHDYVGLIATAKTWTATNDGLASTQLADAAETDNIFASTVTTSSIYTILAGHNDMRGNFTATQQGEWQANLYSTMAWLAIPDANKIKGTAAGCVYAGTWITSTIYGGSFAKASTANASTATCTTTIPSTVVYFNYLKQVGNTSTFSLTVDGVSIVDPQSATGSTTFASLGHITTGLSRNFEPQMVRLSGLAGTVHTVVMTVVSADNSGSNSPYVLWVGSPSASFGNVGPYVYLGNTVRLKTSDYGAFGGSDALVGTFNGLSLSVASDLANDGLNVDYVDAASYYNPNDPTQYSTSSVGNFPFSCTGCPHPTNAGHANIANAFLFEMSGLHTPRDRMGAQMFHGATFGVVNGVPTINGRANSGCLGFGTNGLGSMCQPNNTTQQFNPGSTSFPIAFDFGVSASANYPRLKVSSAGQAQLRNTADNAFFPLQVAALAATSVSINGGTAFTSQTGTGSSVASSTGNAELLFACRGVATASTTIALDFGTCTGTSGLDIPVSAGTLANLRCAANVAGVNASSGVVTVRKNTVNQTMTCTFGTTTACSDTTHTVTVAAGDKVGIAFTTQVAETLNQVSCSIEKQ